MIAYRYEFGVHRLFDGLIEWDPKWRERQFLIVTEGDREPPNLTPAERLAMQPCETAIEFVSGLPGGGKSLTSVKLVIDELIHGHRPIVTNLALNLGRLQEYLHELGHKAHVLDRVFLLRTPEEIRTFYLRRHSNLIIEAPARPDFIDWTPTQEDTRAAGGVFYVIDECHNWFHPQAFEKPNQFTPEHPMFQWASQHRKLKDRCFFVTQSVENVHVAIRRLGQFFHYVRNHRKETYKGFRRGDGFVLVTYLRQPKTDTAEPVEEKPFRLDVRGVASCYYTAGGVGIQTKGVGDGGLKKKGMHLRWLWAGLGLVILGATFVLFVLPKLAVSAAVDSTIGHANKGTPIGEGRVEPGPRPRPMEQRFQTVPAVTTGARVQVTGFVGSVALRRYTLYLSDGRSFSETDGAIQAITRTYAIINGERVYFAKSHSGMQFSK